MGERSGARLRLRVYYEDTDAEGIVYYANYLRYMERGRTEWLRSMGYDHRALKATQGLAFTVSRFVIDYVTPAKLDDELDVTTELQSSGRASFVLEQKVLDLDERLLCRADARIACVDAETLKPRRMPAALLMELTREC